jgi:CheY-like chemotaxis protein
LELLIGNTDILGVDMVGKKLNKILLVDDDYVTNFLNESLIQELEIAEQIKVANNGEEALGIVEGACIEQVNSHVHVCPDLILLDVNMPVMNGFEFLEAFERLKNCYKSKISVVIMLTSSGNPTDLEMARKFDVAGYIYKPLTEEKLQQVLDNLFEE